MPQGGKAIFEVPYGRDPADPHFVDPRQSHDRYLSAHMRVAQSAGVLAVTNRAPSGSELMTEHDLELLADVMDDMAFEAAVRAHLLPGSEASRPPIISVPAAIFAGRELVTAS